MGEQGWMDKGKKSQNNPRSKSNIVPSLREDFNW
jgi:hypothetical protein